jgi:3-methyladenine DNA glycosylase Tag
MHKRLVKSRNKSSRNKAKDKGKGSYEQKSSQVEKQVIEKQSKRQRKGPLWTKVKSSRETSHRETKQKTKAKAAMQNSRQVKSSLRLRGFFFVGSEILYTLLLFLQSLVGSREPCVVIAETTSSQVKSKHFIISLKEIESISMAPITR